MSGLELLGLIGIVVALVLSAMVASAETAFTRMGRARAGTLADEEHRRSERLVQLLERRDHELGALWFVALALHLGIATIVALLVQNWWGSAAVGIAFVVELLVIFIVAEALPKSIALADVDRSATRGTVMVGLIRSLLPVRWLASSVVSLGHRLSPSPEPEVTEVSEEELLAVAVQAAQSEAIDADERELIESVIEFGDTIARQVMSPRPDIVSVSEDTPISEVRDVVIAKGYSRIPVVRDGIDDVVGIAHSKDIMRGQRDHQGAEPISSIMRTVNTVPESKKVAALLREMQAETFHLAIVVDEYGGTAGLLTLEDLIEEVVGEIVDEFDVEQPMIERMLGGDLMVNGKAELDALEDLLGATLPEGEWSTVGGLIFSTLGHVPTPGESLEVEGFRFLVERVQGRRIARVRVSPHRVQPVADEENHPVPGHASAH